MTGIAVTNTPFFFNTLLDSIKNSLNGLKCWADSKAIILSTELSAKGNAVEVAFTKDNFFPVSSNCGRNSILNDDLNSLVLSVGNGNVIFFSLRSLPCKETPNCN